MFRLVLLLLVIDLFSCADNGHPPLQRNIAKDTSLKIIVTGLADLESIIQLDSLAKKYGFKYYPIGCVVSAQKMDSVDRVNNRTYNILEKRYGKGWRKNFNTEYYITNQIQIQADSIINARFPQDNKYFHYLAMATQEKNHYQIKVYSLDSLNGKSEAIVHYKIEIVIGQLSKAKILEAYEKL